MSLLKKLNEITDKAVDYILWTGAIFAFGIVVMHIIQVITRYGLNNSATWCDEFARYLWVALCFLGSGVALHKKVHVQVDFISSRLSKKAYRIQQIIVYTVVLIVSIILFRDGLTLFRSFSDRRGILFRIPLNLVYWTVPVGTFMCVWASALRIINLYFGIEVKK